MKLYYSLALMVLQYFFPLAVLIFTYTRIALAVWGKKAPGEAEDGRDQRLAKAKRKVNKIISYFPPYSQLEQSSIFACVITALLEVKVAELKW